MYNSMSKIQLKNEMIFHSGIALQWAIVVILSMICEVNYKALSIIAIVWLCADEVTNIFFFWRLYRYG